MSDRIIPLARLWIVALALTLLSGCSPGNQQAALEAAVQQLQDNLEAKRSSAVVEQLHPEFRAQQQYDSQWAKRTMLGLFLRFNNVKVIALSKSSTLDPTSTTKGYTEAQVAVTGAEGLIPDSANAYSVKLEWWLEGSEWKLARIDWK
ncbi:hypothetical protein [Pseudomonas turukhanskensis]|uniref:Nuclear transport factor 2 family protein n=1 Tax=Pseudomonas turukhanskensis TaxID=1806536 RepID=A0A9W6KA12_9PSED|nr:hypothetical protein [Pseudomonas turukhanskensis]GLK90425.1 hypothetical protein GCM10017655_34890 [Pseudomonas turukhanskensis]